MYTDDNVILTDCDGVLLNWRHTFFRWMLDKGYKIHNAHTYSMTDAFDISSEEKMFLVSHFNESAAIGSLPPYKDAIHYVRKLHEERGFVFHVITSLTTEKYACELRQKNLENLFGKGVFEDFIFLGTGADKDKALSLYKDSELWWIEDKLKNAIVGKRFGLASLLMKHDHNRDEPVETFGIKHVDNWKQVYYNIIGC